MAGAVVGRIIYACQATPAVEPVNFTVDAGDIVIRTLAGGKLAAAIDGAVVAFEADEYDPVTRTGWSVTAIGEAREVTDPVRIQSLQTSGPYPWMPGDHLCFMGITPRMLDGHHIDLVMTGWPGGTAGLGTFSPLRSGSQSNSLLVGGRDPLRRGATGLCRRQTLARAPRNQDPREAESSPSRPSAFSPARVGRAAGADRRWSLAPPNR